MKAFFTNFSSREPLRSSEMQGAVARKTPVINAGFLPTRRVLLELSREPKFLDGSHDVFDLLASYTADGRARPSIRE